METDEITRLLTDALADEFEIDRALITPDASIMADIGLDSLDIVDLVVVIDRIFGVKLNREDMTSVKTFGELATLIHDRR